MTAQELVNQWIERVDELNRDYDLASSGETIVITKKIATLERVIMELQRIIDADTLK